MAAETTGRKTLEATLAPPTAHKEYRLHRAVAPYRRALSEAFESGGDTQSPVNDVVTGYTLTSYAKDALKSYVPQLRRTDNASELHDDHPVRFVNPAYTSRTCHACGHIGRRGSQTAFRCTNDECLTEYQADITAAANIASRIDPRRESLPWKPAGDASPQDGGTTDSATARSELSAKPAQTTLGEWG